MNVSKNSFKYCLVFSFALISLLSIPNWSQAETYYVATNGNDSNPGTEAQPWLTLDKADSATSSGDIVYVKEGTYSGLGVTKSGITYKSHPSNTTRPKTGQWYFESASNVTIDGFVVTTGNQGGAFILNHANKNNIIRNCEMYECGSIGVDVTGGSDYNIIEDCVIHDCWYAFHTSGSGCRGNIFRRNHCYNHSDAINVSPSAYDTKIIENVIHDCDDDGIHLFDDGKAEVSGNLVYNCKGVAFWVNGSAGIISKNNTVIGVSGAKWGYVVWVEGSNHTFKNNIIYVNAADMQLFTGGGTGNINYNCWWNQQGQASQVAANDIVADPLFVNIAGNDYHLKSNSPCIGAGEGGVDMGAYGVGSEPAPALSVSPTSHDFGSSETNYQFTVKNTGGGTLSWNGSESLDWLSLSKTSGSLGADISENVTATVSRSGKSPGTYNGIISFTSNGSNQDVSVSMIVPAVEPEPQLSVSPTSHDFGSSETNYQLTVKNTGGATLSWNGSESLDWLSLNKTSGSLEAGISENVTATVSRSGKSPGTYNGTISFTSNGSNQDVSVSMTVPAVEPDPQLSVSPTSHDFGSSETNYQFTVKNTGGATLSWNGSESLDWLSLNKTSGSLGAGISENVTATVSRTGKSTGTYNGTISFTSNGSNQDVSVSMIVPSPEVPDPPDNNPGESKPLSGEPVNDDRPSDKEDGVRNRPNPFRAGKQLTLIEYNLEQPSNVTVTIYNLMGQEVWSETYRAGENGGREDNSVPWDGRNLSGEVVGNGGYICRIWVEREKRAMLRKIAIAK